MKICDGEKAPNANGSAIHQKKKKKTELRIHSEFWPTNLFWNTYKIKTDVLAGYNLKMTLPNLLLG